TVTIGPATGELGPQAIIPGATPEAAINPGTSTPPGTPSTPRLVNPIGKGLTPGRVDMGVDYDGSGVLYALEDGTVTSTTNAGWPGGTFICIRLDDGKYIYYAEDITPAVSVTQRVTAGQVIGTATGGPSGIEVGWAAAPGTGTTMAAATGQDAEGLATGDAGNFATGYGVAMSDLIKSLGGPPGNFNGPVQGSVPAGYG
ncbi:MAG: peptidoglycan DD-metalloendopeptidase family protein, partial [Streptosporangiaceae bacterium]|nr:peptidoglycan DD-metalloendopeptidase family protein [Streptosporangiaceae bacterium]